MPVGLCKILVEKFIKSSITLSSYLTSIIESPNNRNGNSIMFYNLKEKINQEVPQMGRFLSENKDNLYKYIELENKQDYNQNSKIFSMIALHIKVVQVLKLNKLVPEYDGDSVEQLIDDEMLIYSKSERNHPEEFPEEYIKIIKEQVKLATYELRKYLDNISKYNDFVLSNIKDTQSYSAHHSIKEEYFGINIRYVETTKWEIWQVYKIMKDRIRSGDKEGTPFFMNSGNIENFLKEFYDYLEKLSKNAVKCRRDARTIVRTKVNNIIYSICSSKKEVESLIASKMIVEFVVLWFTGNWLISKNAVGRGDIVTFSEVFLDSEKPFNNRALNLVELDPGQIKRLFNSASFKTQSIIREFIPEYKISGIGTAELPINMFEYKDIHDEKIVEVFGESLGLDTEVTLKKTELKKAVGQYGEELWRKLESIVENRNEKRQLTPLDLLFIREWGIQQKNIEYKKREALNNIYKKVYKSKNENIYTKKINTSTRDMIRHKSKELPPKIVQNILGDNSQPKGRQSSSIMGKVGKSICDFFGFLE